MIIAVGLDIHPVEVPLTPIISCPPVLYCLVGRITARGALCKTLHADHERATAYLG